MSTSQLILFIFWIATVIIVSVFHLYRWVKNKEKVSLFEIIGGFVTLCFMAPCFWVLGILFLLNETRIKL